MAGWIPCTQGGLERSPRFLSAATGSEHALCGKLYALEKLLRRWKRTRCKVLLFSRRVQMLNVPVIMHGILVWRLFVCGCMESDQRL